MVQSHNLNITFVLSSINRSGGSRVTVEMANRLIGRGYAVRIAVRKQNPFTLVYAKRALKTSWLAAIGADYKHWGAEFIGQIVYFNDLEFVDFSENEVVIAVGTDEIETVRSLSKKVNKIRFCHGFAPSRPELTRKVWSGSMTTIAVSATLIPDLEAYSGEKVLAVVPNGIRTDQYFDMRIPRDGVGMVFSGHYNKSPEDALELIRRIRAKWPMMPLYIFGEAARPASIPKDCYWRYPAIAKARELYNRSKLWLMTSRMEGLPGPVLEAMACGAVMVSADNPGSREIIRNETNGILVPIGDIDAMMDKIEFLLQNDQERARLTANANETVAEYNWERAVDKMVNVLNELST